MKNVQKIGLFGGSFDPVHMGHIGLAIGAKKELKLDKVIFIPARIPPHKLSKRPAPAEIRLKMLRAALKNHNGFQVSRYELDRRPPTYTYQTLEHFSRLYPRSKLYFMIGMDSLLELKTWKRTENLFELAQFAVTLRAGVKTPAKTPFRERILMLKTRPAGLSSSVTTSPGGSQHETRLDRPDAADPRLSLPRR